jgi:hypothetical protein
MAISDDHLRDLPPQARRYDTAVEDDLLFAVFPNGTKCWVLVYTAAGFARRRTLGLFPEMKLARAREAAAEARRILAAETELARYGEPTAAAARRGWLVMLVEGRPYLAVALGTGFAAGLGLLIVWLLG